VHAQLGEHSLALDVLRGQNDLTRSTLCQMKHQPESGSIGRKVPMTSSNIKIATDNSEDTRSHNIIKVARKGISMM